VIMRQCDNKLLSGPRNEQLSEYICCLLSLYYLVFWYLFQDSNFFHIHIPHAAVSRPNHIGTSPTTSLHPLTSLSGYVSVLRTDSNFSYLAVDFGTYGRRAFLIAGLTVRNSLPYELRDLTRGSDSFKQFLKIILFMQFFILM